MNSLQLVEAMASLSAAMVEAARANDWPRLTDLQQRQAGLRERLAEIDKDFRYIVTVRGHGFRLENR